MSKVKENKGLRGDVLEYVAQASPQFDTEIGQKDHFRMETRLSLMGLVRRKKTMALGVGAAVGIGIGS